MVVSIMSVCAAGGAALFAVIDSNNLNYPIVSLMELTRIRVKSCEFINNVAAGTSGNRVCSL